MPEDRRSALRAWVPVVVALLVQLGTTAAVLGLHAARWRGQHGPFPGLGRQAAVNPLLDVEAHALRPGVALALILLALIGPALLLAVRRLPGPLSAAVAATAVAGTVLCATQYYGSPFYLSVLFAAAIAAFRRARTWAWASVGAYWLAYAGAYLISGNVVELAWLVPLTVVSALALVGPEFARGRRELRERLRRDAETRRAEEAQAERVRIARELHDVLAHSLSQINVQASVGLHLFAQQPDKAAEALASIKDSSKTALGEVRQVLGMLRDGASADAEAPLAPEPELSRLPALVDGVRAQGLDARLTLAVTDAARVPAPVQQAAYRIAQEALTNVTRHARARRVEVVVAEAAGRLRVTVTDDGIGDSATASADGRGLLGMRERAQLLGGSFAAGPRPEGGFEVAAELPLPPGASAEASVPAPGPDSNGDAP